jgi:hypothetical protein
MGLSLLALNHCARDYGEIERREAISAFSQARDQSRSGCPDAEAWDDLSLLL